MSLHPSRKIPARAAPARLRRLRAPAAALALGLAVALAPLAAADADSERDARRLACAVEASGELGAENERCMEENSAETDDCGRIGDFQSRRRCKRRATAELERCFKRATAAFKRQERRCKSLR